MRATLFISLYALRNGQRKVDRVSSNGDVTEGGAKMCFGWCDHPI